MKAFFQYLLAGLIFVVLSTWISQFVYDGDNFYHLGHARVYWENGPFYRPFPWVTYSVISKHNSDIWWGFHVLLSPLTILQDKVLILLAGPAFLMLLNLLISRSAVIKLGFNQWYGLALLPASLGFFTRMDTVRPQVLSAPLLILLFAGLVTDSVGMSLFASVALGFVHPTLAYMMLMVSFFTVLQRGLYKEKWNAWLELSCLAVVLAIACIRPGMEDGLKLLKIQLLDLAQVRKAGEVKNFGVELDPTNMAYFLRAYLSPIIVAVVSLVVFARFRDKERDLGVLFASLGVVGAATILSFAITRRGVDQFAPFMVLTILILLHQCKDIKKFAAALVGVHAVFVFGAFVQQAYSRPHQKNATDFKGATEWLIKNTKPGELVGQSVWSDFGPLFYWDQHNHYFGGMDPIFQYKYDPQMYWRMNLTAAGRDLGSTSPYNPMKVSDKEEPISTVYPRDMKTKWMICSKTWSSDGVQEVLKSDPRAKIRYEDATARVYEFLP